MRNVDWIGVYPATKDKVTTHIHQLFRHKIGPGSIPKFENKLPSVIGLISPHAGYACSGPVAAHGYYQVGTERNKAELVIIAGPNHHGGVPLALPPHDAWSTPIGNVPVAVDLVKKIDQFRKRVERPLKSFIQVDENAHRHEHSIELQLPFLQTILSDFSILPLGVSGSLGELTDSQMEEISNLVVEALEDLNINDVLVIASTDFTHGNFMPILDHDTVTSMDKHAVDEILKFGKESINLREVVIRENITMCGYLPVKFVMHLSSKLGATKAECLKYATSGETCGGKNSVVGYASICLKK